jgi:hypothetical protein
MPHLEILSATFAGADFTSQFQDLVTTEGTLTLNTAYPEWQQNTGWTDPFSGNVKSFVVLYQWDNRDLELLVMSENSGIVNLDPNVPVDPSRTQFLNPDGGSGRSRGDGFQIFAITWGAMEGQNNSVAASIYNSVTSTGFFTPSNDYFGFDGQPGVTKTGVVIYQLGFNPDLGGIRSESAVERGPLGKLVAVPA